jgi:DNA-binding NtrC family response regulator
MEFLPKILIVDDDKSMRFFLAEAMKKEGYVFDVAADGKEALEKLEKGRFQIVLMDIKMPQMNGFLVLEKIKAMDPYLLVIMMTAYGSQKVAIAAIQKGAYDYFTKPFDLNEMRVVIKRAMEKSRLQQEIFDLQSRLEAESNPGIIIGTSPAMQPVFDLIAKVAASDVTVLITGESGTGKELVARAIHKRSERRNEPFVTVNCCAIPENLLEAELFGHEKGAFTGAHQQRHGKFELAHQGTIFLDEIGDMSLSMQTKILRVLQEKEIEPVGGSGPIKVDLRLLAATHRNLQAAIENGSFREDLYFRLNVVNIPLPPLRERTEDLKDLTDYFIKKYNQRFQKTVKGLTERAKKLLLSYHWPGNVRELENLIQRTIVLTEEQELSDELIGGFLKRETDDAIGSLKEKVGKSSDEIEKRTILEALGETGWRREETAKRLKISRKNLYNKIKKYGLLE